MDRPANHALAPLAHDHTGAIDTRPLREALDGITVVDFTQVGAGPTCTMLLADLGARVIKVEPPEGDLGRGLGPGWIGADSALFHGFNRNKLGVALDLKSPGGLAAARRLIASADVVVESMRPGVMARLGLDAALLTIEHPRLVWCAISAYGQQGPYADQAGVDGILQADSGLMSLIGLPDGEPCKVQAPVVDVMAGYVACTGVLARLAQRQRDGQGGLLDVNLMNAALALQQSSLTSFLADREAPVKAGSAAPYSAPNQAYRTADGWIMVAAYMPGRWQRLCALLGLPALANDPCFATSPQRVAHRPALAQALEAVFRTQPTSHWLRTLKAADILCAPVADYREVLVHPQVTANRMIVQASHPRHGDIAMPGFPINSASENLRAPRPAPTLGQHTRDVLQSLGYTPADVDRLAASGAVVAAPDQALATTSPAAEVVR